MRRRIIISLPFVACAVFAGAAVTGFLSKSTVLMVIGAVLAVISLAYGSMVLLALRKRRENRALRQEQKLELQQEQHSAAEHAPRRRPVPEAEESRDSRRPAPEATQRRQKRRPAEEEELSTQEPPVRRSREDDKRPRRRALPKETVKVKTHVNGVQNDRYQFTLQRTVEQLIQARAFQDYGKGMSDRVMRDDYEVGKIEEGEYRWALEGRKLPYAKIQPDAAGKGIQVLVSPDGEFYKRIGTIPGSKGREVSALLQETDQCRVTAVIKGGKYKYIEDNFHPDKEGDGLRVIANARPLEVDLFLQFDIF